MKSAKEYPCPNCGEDKRTEVFENAVEIEVFKAIQEERKRIIGIIKQEIQDLRNTHWSKNKYELKECWDCVARLNRVIKKIEDKEEKVR